MVEANCNVNAGADLTCPLCNLTVCPSSDQRRASAGTVVPESSKRSGRLVTGRLKQPSENLLYTTVIAAD